MLKITITVLDFMGNKVSIFSCVKRLDTGFRWVMDILGPYTL
jgi:hypothetical protein